MKGCAGCEKVAAALAGARDDLIAVFDHSVLMLGEHQLYPGYCVLWSREHAKELHHLPDLAYQAFFNEAKGVGAALEAGLKPRKLNLVSLGNQVQHAHLHLFPRYEDDPRKLEHPWSREAEFKPLAAAQKAHWAQRLKEIIG